MENYQSVHKFKTANNTTMKLFVVALIIAGASAAKLDSTYLPPNSAKSAGGSGGILAAPNGIPHPISKSAEGGAAILRLDNENNGDGSYKFAFETENRIIQSEEGKLKNAGSEHEALEVHGSYSYIAPNGQTITVQYIADENGFQAAGDHLPTSPPIPEAILKSLQINAAAEATGAGFSSQQSGNQQGGYKY